MKNRYHSDPTGDHPPNFGFGLGYPLHRNLHARLVEIQTPVFFLINKSIAYKGCGRATTRNKGVGLSFFLQKRHRCRIWKHPPLIFWNANGGGIFFEEEQP